MVPVITVVLIAIPIYWIYSNLSGLLKNIAAAKRSGLPYVITPFDVFNILFMMTLKLWMPIFKLLPQAWTEDWINLVNPEWIWQLLYEPFKKNGDTFITVSPGSFHVWVSTPEAIHQIANRREAFPKNLESYKILDIYGRNVVTTEGVEWKQHRKISSPSFNEKNNALVFGEACRQAQGMLRKWTGANGEENKTVEELPMDTMRLTLHIISRIGFGVHLLWPGEKPKEKQSVKDAEYSSNEAPDGHSMNFENALSTLLDRVLWVLLTPKWLLKRIPTKGAQEAYQSFVNWGQYMNELFAQKVDEARQGKKSEGMDILGALVRSAYGEESADTQKPSPDRAGKGKVDKRVLSDSDILGNAFVMILAGHETTANSVHFSLIELACNVKCQQSVQKEVEAVFGDSDPQTWDYDSNINKLLGGVVGAVMNEQLRLMPPVVAIPKMVTPSQDQVLVIDGKRCTLPASAHIALCTVPAHRNPKYWPTQPSKITGRDNDMDDFRPERWLKTVGAGAGGKQQAKIATELEDDSEFEGFTGQDTHAQLYRPVRGSYLPFSLGARSCLGRRLAQVEIMGVLAVIFQKYSIELAVDEWATDAEVARMSDEEKRVLYKKAQEKARQTMRSATSTITLRLPAGFIPVRVVRKGEERFAHVVE